MFTMFSWKNHFLLLVWHTWENQKQCHISVQNVSSKYEKNVFSQELFFFLVWKCSAEIKKKSWKVFLHRKIPRGKTYSRKLVFHVWKWRTRKKGFCSITAAVLPPEDVDRLYSLQTPSPSFTFIRHLFSILPKDILTCRPGESN